MELHVFAERAWMSVAFVTSLVLAVVRFVRRMNVRVLLSVAGVSKAAITTREFTHKRLFTRVSSFVNL